jgi:hypothetical protein
MFMQIIYVNDDFNVEEAEGSHLTDDLVVGKQIAGGAQVCGMWKTTCSLAAFSCCPCISI